MLFWLKLNLAQELLRSGSIWLRSCCACEVLSHRNRAIGGMSQDVFQQVEQCMRAILSEHEDRLHAYFEEWMYKNMTLVMNRSMADNQLSGVSPISPLVMWQLMEASDVTKPVSFLVISI